MTAIPPPAPRVTVLLPVHNGERYLKGAIDSVLRQTFGDFELLVVDDGSTDGSADAARSCGDPRLRLVRNEANLGIARALDRGLAAAAGGYVARIDCDDESLPERLERQVRYLDGHPEVGVLGTGYASVDDRDRPVETVRPPREHEALVWRLFFGNPLAHPSVMMRREAAVAAGGYAPAGFPDPPTRVPEDYDLWMRMSRRCRLSCLPETLVRIRKHGGNLMASHAAEYLGQAARICRREIAGRLGEEIPEGVPRCFLTRTCGSPAEWGRAMEIFRRLYVSFASDAALDGRARRAVRREAASLFLELARRNAPRAGAGGIVRALAGYGPAFAGDLLRALARKAAARL